MRRLKSDRDVIKDLPEKIEKDQYTKSNYLNFAY